MNCAVSRCGRAAVRVIDGRDYCAGHGEGARTPEGAIAKCEICGTPVARPGASRCDTHQRWGGPAAAKEA
jgi:hypothetical protein